jgi:hypothetical protein
MVASLIFTLVAICSDSVKTGNMIGYFFQMLIVTFSGVAQLTNFQFWEFIPVLNFANAFLLGFQNTLTLNSFLLLTFNVVVLLGILYFYTLKYS